MDVTLSAEQENLIHEKIRSGDFPNAAAVVDEAPRLLEDRDKLKRLKAEIAVGIEQLERGEGILWTPALMEELILEATEAARQGEPIPDVVKP